MLKQKQACKQNEVYPSRHVWVVEEWRLNNQELAQETFGYNDWDIYHGA